MWSGAPTCAQTWARIVQARRRLLGGEKGRAGAGNAGLVQHPLPELIPQHMPVVAADVGQRRGHGIQRPRLVVAPAHAGLHGRPLHLMLLEEGQGDEDRDFVEGVGMGRIAQRQAAR